MNVRTLIQPRHSYLRFALSAALVVLLCRAIMLSPRFLARPELGFWAITFDLCVTIPLLYIVFVVRPGHSSLATVAPVFIACTAIAHAIVPSGQRGLLERYAVVAALFEIGVVIYVVMALREGWRRGRGETDLLQRIRMVCERILGKGVAAEVIATEMALMLFGCAGWRLASPAAEEGTTTFHRRAGWGSIVSCLIVLIAAEGIAVHLFLQQWSVTAAWVLTALDLYSVLWLIGDYQAFRLRRSSVNGEVLSLRFGFRWSADIPLSNLEAIEAVSASEAEVMRRDRSYLRLSILDEPEFLLRFREPVTVSGLMGWKRVVTRIGLRPDEPAFAEILRARCAAL